MIAVMLPPTLLFAADATLLLLIFLFSPLICAAADMPIVCHAITPRCCLRFSPLLLLMLIMLLMLSLICYFFSLLPRRFSRYFASFTLFADYYAADAITLLLLRHFQLRHFSFSLLLSPVCFLMSFTPPCLFRLRRLRY